MRAVALAILAASCMPPSWGAGALLHPRRKPVEIVPALAHRDVVVEGGGATLRGWLFPAEDPSAGTTIVYLHGSADNRASGLWIAERLVRAGYDVLAYDSRAHGESGGEACTYGYHEKRDLSRALDALGVTRAVLVGASLGAAVALQAAAEDPRVVAVVAAATFSDLETVARERAPWFASEGQIQEAMAIAEREGRFQVAAVSPVLAARRIRVPVLLVHGADDAETPPAHAERVLAALTGPGRLLAVPGAGHADALGRAWTQVERWIAAVAPRGPGPPGPDRPGSPVHPVRRSGRRPPRPKPAGGPATAAARRTSRRAPRSPGSRRGSTAGAAPSSPSRRRRA